MQIKTLTLAALMASAAIAPAQAGSFLFQYNWNPLASDPGSPMSASLYLNTSDTLNALGGYDILSASGTIDGVAVLGLKPNPDQPNNTADGIYIYDNVLYTSGFALDPPGLVVLTTDHEFNFGYDGSQYYAISWLEGSTRLNSHGQPIPDYRGSVGNASLTAVPEPASWAMMVGGFGLAGAAMRRRRAAVSFA